VSRSAIFATVIATLLVGPSAVAAESVGVVTILEGDATVIRGLSEYTLAEGVRVLSNDLVETGKATFLRVEFSDGAIVDLGPITRAQLNRPSLRKNDRPAFYLLSGWLKVTAGKLGAGAKGAIGSPQFDAIGLDGESVERAEHGSSAVFAENGPLRVVDRRRNVPAPIVLKSGDFLGLRNDEAPAVSGRAAHEFVAAMPRQFEDSLPPQSARFQGRDVHPKAIGAFTYAQVEAWLDAELAVRRRFVHEWAAKAEEDAFRQRLEARLSRHPEWEPVLYPERFEPKLPTPATSEPPAPVAGGSIRPIPSVPTTTPDSGAPHGAASDSAAAPAPGSTPEAPDPGASGAAPGH
jgi:hypothetical protein